MMINQADDNDVELRAQLRDKGFTDVTALASAVRELTARSPKTPKDMWRFKPIGSRAVRLRRAEDLRNRLVAYRTELQRDIPAVDDPLALQLDAAIDDRDTKRLTALGINTEYAWLGDVIAAVVAGEYVDVETVGPYMSAHLDADGRLQVSPDNLPPDERAGMMLAELIRDVTEDFANVTLVALLDDYTWDVEVGSLSQLQRDLFVVEMRDVFQQFGAIRPGDMPGQRFVLLQEDALVSEVDRMIAMLRDSAAGVVTQRSALEVVFTPSDTFIETLALHSNNRNRELRRRGIALQRDGRPLCHTLDAASFLHPVSHLLVHLKILDKRFAVEQDRVYALGRAMNILRQENVHDIFFDTDLLSPALVSYAVCRLIEREVDDLMRDLRAFDDWAAVDPEEYVMRNYGRRVLPEDRGIMAFVIEQIERAGLAERDAPLVADVGAGPNFYPIMLLAPYVSDDGAIDMIEFSAANRGYAEGLLDESRTLTATPQPWQRFQDTMVELGGARYADAFARACRRANVVEGSIYSLPMHRYAILTAFFVAESIASTRRDFHRAIRALARALEPDGLLVTTHMLDSRGWPSGLDTNFPAVPLTVADIEEAYRDAGLEFTIRRFEAEPADKARDGYHGMAAVVARRTRQPLIARASPRQRTGSAVPAQADHATSTRSGESRELMPADVT
ncbi:hypothetical protein AB0H83_21935 [Dactylosporangium sp. NPDC050688]|uniref:hypothetical protein n=1 Tax=Dactylosporangium sp. NPDC050688 TaxID=3157217 RepID=UPI0033D379D9